MLGRSAQLRKMKKNQIQIIVSILILSGCCQEPKLLKNGLTKEVDKVTEFSVMVYPNSEKNINFDTIAITEKFYNKNNQIDKRIDNLIFDNKINEIDIIYDESKNIKKEIIKTSFDTTIVNHFYKDGLLHKTSTSTIKPEYKFEQNTIHKYNQNRKLKEILTSQLYVDKRSNDTTLNILEKDKYNKKEQLENSQFINQNNHKESTFKSYKYTCGRLKSIDNYNYRDSLISITTFDYVFDEHNNWIEMKSKENGVPRIMKLRQINYK